MTKKNMIMKLFFWAVVLILVVCAGVSLVSGRSGIAVNANSSTYSLDGSSMPSGNTDSEDPALPDPKKSEPAADPDGPKKPGSKDGPAAKKPDPKAKADSPVDAPEPKITADPAADAPKPKAKDEPIAKKAEPKNSGPGAKSVPDPKPAPQNPGPGAALSV